MKKTLIVIAIACIAVGAASAQPRMGQMTVPGNGRGFNTQASNTIVVEKITLEGALQLVDTRVAIKKDNKTYFVMIPHNLFGFIDGLKEGANVKIEGYSHEIPGVKDSYAVRVSTLTINGRTIDLTSAAGTNGTMGRGMMGGLVGQGQDNGNGMMGGQMGHWGR